LQTKLDSLVSQDEGLAVLYAVVEPVVCQTVLLLVQSPHGIGYLSWELSAVESCRLYFISCQQNLRLSIDY